MVVVERWPLPEVQLYFFADRSIPKPPMYPLPAKCWHLAFFEKVWSNSQVCWQFRWSNAPPPPPLLGLQKASHPLTNQRLFKNFPCVKINKIVHSRKPNITVNIGATSRVLNNTFETFFDVVSI